MRWHAAGFKTVPVNLRPAVSALSNLGDRCIPGGQSLAGIADEILLRLSAFDPRLKDTLYAGWGAKSTAALLAKFLHLESIPVDWSEWHVNAANASVLAATLARELDRALLFRTLATLRTDIPLFEDVDHLRWNGPTPAIDALAVRFDAATTQVKGPGRDRVR